MILQPGRGEEVLFSRRNRHDPRTDHLTVLPVRAAPLTIPSNVSPLLTTLHFLPFSSIPGNVLRFSFGIDFDELIRHYEEDGCCSERVGEVREEDVRDDHDTCWRKGWKVREEGGFEDEAKS